MFGPRTQIGYRFISLLVRLTACQVNAPFICLSVTLNVNVPDSGTGDCLACG